MHERAFFAPWIVPLLQCMTTRRSSVRSSDGLWLKWALRSNVLVHDQMDEAIHELLYVPDFDEHADAFR